MKQKRVEKLENVLSDLEKHMIQSDQTLEDSNNTLKTYVTEVKEFFQQNYLQITQIPNVILLSTHFQPPKFEGIRQSHNKIASEFELP